MLNRIFSARVNRSHPKDLTHALCSLNDGEPRGATRGAQRGQLIFQRFPQE